jgi:type IV pilus assembly protein PilA
MKNKKGFTLVELLGVIVIIAIIIAIAVPSYMKIKLSIDKKNYENKKELIEVAATKYSEDTNITTLYVDDLIKSGYLEADDEDGNIYGLDKENQKIRINCYIVRSNENNGLYYGELLEESYEENGECQANIPNNISKQLKIIIYDGEYGNILTYNDGSQWWTKNNIILEAKFEDEDNVAKYEWYEGYDTTPIESNNTGFTELTNNTNNQKYKVSTDSVLQQNYTVKVTTKDGKVLKTAVRVYIDKLEPQFYKNDATDVEIDTWTISKKYNIKAYDDESGLYGYKIIENNDDCPNEKSEYNSTKKYTYNTDTVSTKYKVCIIDNVGNFSSKEIEVKKIDTTKMKCNIELSGTKGNIYNGNQWYIGSNLTISVKPESVGLSGVYLGLSTSTIAQYSNYFENENGNDAKVTSNISQNINGTKYYGFIKNQVENSEETCSKNIYYENNITAPTLTSATSTYDKITASYTAGSAISGISSTTCELTNSNGITTSYGTLSGNNCIFNVTATKENTTYYFKKCITSKAGNKACSTVSSKANVGYCTSGNYKKNTIEKSQIAHDIYFNNGEIPTPITQYYTYCERYNYVSKYNSSLVCIQPVIQYCNSGYGSGTCTQSSDSSCSILNFRSIETSLSMPNYFSSSDRLDQGNWHVLHFQHCTNGNEISGEYSCVTGTNTRYKKDTDGNIHEWYQS